MLIRILGPPGLQIHVSEKKHKNHQLDLIILIAFAINSVFLDHLRRSDKSDLSGGGMMGSIIT